MILTPRPYSLLQALQCGCNLGQQRGRGGHPHETLLGVCGFWGYRAGTSLSKGAARSADAWVLPELFRRSPVKTWRGTAHVHAWEEDAGQGSIPHTHRWSGAHLIWDDLPLCSLFHLPAALSHAHEELMPAVALGKPQFACTIPTVPPCENSPTTNRLR